MVYTINIKRRQSTDESRGRVHVPQQLRRRPRCDSHHPGRVVRHDGLALRENPLGNCRHRVHLPAKFHVPRLFIFCLKSLKKETKTTLHYIVINSFFVTIVLLFGYLVARCDEVCPQNKCR